MTITSTGNLVSTVLLDYDDTMACTERIALGAAYDYMVAELTKRGVMVNHSKSHHIDRFAGTTFREILSQLEPELDFSLNKAEINELVEEEVRRVLDALGSELEPMPGSLEMLQRFRDLGIGSAIVSSSATHRLQVCLECTGQNEYIQASSVFSASDSMGEPKSKPDPAIYLFALKRLDLKAEDTIAVEDSLSGCQSALAAGIRCLGFTGALNHDKKGRRKEQLLEVGAFEVVDSLADVERFLARGT